MDTAKSPLVSVIMTVYNEERFLRQALDSIFAQTWSDFELIVVDDASTDSTPQILNSYSDRRLIRLTNEKNLGPYGSANKALSVAHGKYIARHDADDESLPDRLKQQVEAFMRGPDLVLLGTSYFVIDEQGSILDVALLPIDNVEIQDRLGFGNLYCHGSVMMRHDAVRQVGGYRDFFPVSQDYDLFLRLAELGQVANLAAPLYLFRFHSNSLSRKKKEQQLACRRLAWALAVQRRSSIPEGPIPDDVVNAYPPEPAKLFLDARGTAYLYYAAGRIAEATTAIQRALEILPRLEPTESSWQDWSLSRANLLAELRSCPQAGVDFIRWVFERLPVATAKRNANETIGRFYADQVFVAYQHGATRLVLGATLQAIRHDPRWVGNSGLWVITWKALTTQPKAANTVAKGKVLNHRRDP
jgi:GT2 family glycosyltransferase